jgi:hypothetical protein
VTVHQLFIGSVKAYDSVRREVGYISYSEWSEARRCFIYCHCFSTLL